MHGNLKWLPMVFISLFLFGCSHSSGPANELAQQSPPQSLASQGGVPCVVLFDTSFDLGEIAEDGISNVHEFKIANKGTGVLVIKKVLPGCGSSVVRFDKTIPPGGEGTIKVGLNPKGCTSNTKIKVFDVLTNDPVQDHFQLKLAGHAE